MELFSCPSTPVWYNQLSTVQFTDAPDCANVQALFSSQALKAQTHPAMLAEVDALLLTLSCLIQKVPGKANIGPASLLLSYLPPLR